MREMLAPILFDDQEKQLEEALRSSMVAPAQRSPGAKQKDFTKRNDSFRTLLDYLGTLAKNRVRVPGGQPCEFYMLTRPNELQARALGLLGIPVAL